MAQKRMISNTICGTVAFTDMSASARALYLHLHCESDEDGCCRGAAVLRHANLRRSALDELIDNGYVIPLEDTPPKERVVYIADWHMLNKYKHALATVPVYRTQLLRTIPNIEKALFSTKNADNFAPRLGQVRLGQVRSGQVRSGEAEGQDSPFTDDTTPTTNVTGDHNIPSVDDVAQLYVSDYYIDIDDARDVATKFCAYNNNRGWNKLKTSTWQQIAMSFVSHDDRFNDPDDIAKRKSQRIEAERIKSEEQRRQQEYDAMFREAWNPRCPIFTGQAMIDYVRADHFTKQDFDLGKCLYDKLYTSRTLDESTVISLFDTGILAYDETSDWIMLRDYEIAHADEPTKGIAEHLRHDSWNEKYQAPSRPEPLIVPKQDTKVWQTI